MNLTVLAFVAPLVFAQDRPRFEVTSVKPVQADPQARHPISCSGGRFIAQNVPAEYVIGWAYVIKTELAVPQWATRDGERYMIEGKAAAPVDFETCRLMVQQLLEDRFQLKIHTEVRQVSVYNLSVAKGGAKLREIRADAAPAESDGVFLDGYKTATKGWEMWKIATYLGSLPSAGRPVIDKTGLTGLYGFRLDFAGEGKGDFFTTIQEQLGLKLDPGKAPVEFYVVDHLERPSQN